LHLDFAEHSYRKEFYAAFSSAHFSQKEGKRNELFLDQVLLFPSSKRIEDNMPRGRTPNVTLAIQSLVYSIVIRYGCSPSQVIATL
jgi:hypothetical protein